MTADLIEFIMKTPFWVLIVGALVYVFKLFVDSKAAHEAKYEALLERYHVLVGTHTKAMEDIVEELRKEHR